jgi:signal transduction histidine kinase
MGTGARARHRSRSERGEQLMSCVSDTGVGLPREQANQIFNAFFTTASRDRYGIGPDKSTPPSEGRLLLGG